MLPEVGSTITPPGFSSPLRSAASMMRSAMRSLDEPPGFRYSTFTAMVALMPSVTWLSLTSGVLPMSSDRELWMVMTFPLHAVLDSWAFEMCDFSSYVEKLAFVTCSY